MTFHPQGFKNTKLVESLFNSLNFVESSGRKFVCELCWHAADSVEQHGQLAWQLASWIRRDAWRFLQEATQWQHGPAQNKAFIGWFLKSKVVYSHFRWQRQHSLAVGLFFLNHPQAKANRKARLVSAISLRWLLHKRFWAEGGWMKRISANGIIDLVLPFGMTLFILHAHFGTFTQPVQLSARWTKHSRVWGCSPRSPVLGNASRHSSCVARQYQLWKVVYTFIHFIHIYDHIRIFAHICVFSRWPWILYMTIIYPH